MAEPRAALILGADRFTEVHARRYMKIWREKGGAEAKKWALDFLDQGPLDRMIAKVNEIRSKTP